MILMAGGLLRESGTNDSLHLSYCSSQCWRKGEEAHLLDLNPTHHREVQKWEKMHTSERALAGYLGLPDTTALHEFAETPENSQLLATYKQAKENGFACKDGRPTAPIPTRDVFNCLRLRDDVNPQATSLPLAPQRTEYRANHSVLVAMRFLLQRNPHIVQGAPWPSYDPIHGYDLEDWYRALEALRWHTRKTSGARGGRHAEGTAKPHRWQTSSYISSVVTFLRGSYVTLQENSFHSTNTTSLRVKLSREVIATVYQR